MQDEKTIDNIVIEDRVFIPNPLVGSIKGNAFNVTLHCHKDQQSVISIGTIRVNILTIVIIQQQIVSETSVNGLLSHS